MELKDTISMMTSEDYKERFKAEYYQLKIRVGELEKKIGKDAKGHLQIERTRPQLALKSQYWHMKSYLCDLETRAKLEGVKLEE